MSLSFVGNANVAGGEVNRMASRKYSVKGRRYQDSDDRREERDDGVDRRDDLEERGQSDDRRDESADSVSSADSGDSQEDERLEDHLPPADNYEQRADSDDMSDSNGDGISDRGIPVDEEGNAEQVGEDEFEDEEEPEDYDKFLRNLHFALRHHPILFDILARNARMAEDEAAMMAQGGDDAGGGEYVSEEVGDSEGEPVDESGVAEPNVVPEDEGGDEGSPDDRLTPEQIDELQERLRMEQAMGGGLIEEPKPGGPPGGIGPDVQPIEEPVDRLDQPEGASGNPVQSSGGSGGRKYFIGRTVRGVAGALAGRYIGSGIGEMAFGGEGGSEAMKQGAKLIGTGLGGGVGFFYGKGGKSKKYAPSGVASSGKMNDNQLNVGAAPKLGGAAGGKSMGSGPVKMQGSDSPLTYQAAVKNLLGRLNRVESELKRKDKEIESLKFVNSYGHSKLLVYQLQLQGVKALSDPEKAERMVQYMATLDPESRVAYADEIATHWEKDPVLAEAVSGVPSDDFVTVYQGHVEGSDPVSDHRAMPVGGMERVLQFMRSPEGKKMQREGRTFEEIKQYALGQTPLQNG